MDDLLKRCDVCGQPLKRHNSDAGIPICPGIYAPGYRTTLRDQIERLQDEVERLREAVGHAVDRLELATHAKVGTAGEDHWRASFQKWANDARAALNSTKENPNAN